MTRVSQLWDQIEPWDFHEDIKDIVADDVDVDADDDNNNNNNNNDKDGNDDKGFSALGHDRDMGFSRGHQGRQRHRPHDDDDDEEKDNEVGDNDKDDNNDKGISALGLDRDLGFSRGLYEAK